MISARLVEQTVDIIKSGGLIAYPTESIYGLGCDPFNQQAVLRLLKLKNRPPEKGLILVASNLNQLLPLILPKHPDDLARALKTWPGHHSWIFPKSPMVPSVISGRYDSIAIRLSKHPVIKQICDGLNHALVSTSANLTNQDDLKSITDIRLAFGDKIQLYIDAAIGIDNKASTIIDAHTLEVIRQG